MVFNNKYTVGIEQAGLENKITNRAILEIMEDIASLHSATVGFGLKDIEISRQAWILLDWQIKVIRRPEYNEEISVNTWSRSIEKICAYRDFEFKDADGELLIIGTSRWLLMDIDKRRPVKVTEELAKIYKSEPNRKVFYEDIREIEYNSEISAGSPDCEYKVMRRDIDVNNHMHNLNYLDVAMEALPEDVYNQGRFNFVRIQYKKELKYGDAVECYYKKENDRHIVVIMSESKVHALVGLEE